MHGLTLAALLLALTACSGLASVPETNEAGVRGEPAEAAPGSANGGAVAQAPLPGAPAAAPASGAQATASKVLGKKDRKMVDGSTACYVDFVYGGEKPQQMLWDEPCAKTDAGMIGRAKLEELGWWEKLDAFARKFVEGMPGGQVLYISGEFSASIFPVGTTGEPYEVEVAD